jgi:hypothetical protein
VRNTVKSASLEPCIGGFLSIETGGLLVIIPLAHGLVVVLTLGLYHLVPVFRLPIAVGSLVHVAFPSDGVLVPLGRFRDLIVVAVEVIGGKGVLDGVVDAGVGQEWRLLLWGKSTSVLWSGLTPVFEKSFDEVAPNFIAFYEGVQELHGAVVSLLLV